jgi:ABC-type Mn2+/Zn2+ transport system permease subunit
MFRGMYWPLIGGFIAFLLFAVLLGWIMDTSRHGADDRRH